nr:LOW QUALITY PROTEIN: uncharacterized protein LOC129283537 [Lytechinus pictus]
MWTTKSLGIIWIIILAFTSWTVAQTAFQPECAAWDRMIRSITKNVRKIPTARAQCSRSKDCTRFACKFLMLRKDIIFDIKLFPCTTPAQMRLLVLSNTDNVYFEQTVMNGNTYPIPGLTYNIFPGMRLQISVQVHFKKLAAGLKIGLRLKFSGPTPLITFQYPIFPDFIIPVRECTTAETPALIHCRKMNSTVTSLTLPRAHTCTMATGCGGLACSGAVVSAPSVQNIPYNISVELDGCDSPLSYTVAISTALGSWQYKFFRSKDIIVDMIFPQRTAFVKLSMKPDLNLETMTTSLILRSCVDRLPCFDTGLLNQVAIPIPPCNSVAPTGSSPTMGSTPQQDECLIWRNVETELIQSAGPGYGITSCTTIENCSGYNCTGEFEGHNYTIVTVLKHCRDPAVLHMIVSSVTDRFFWQKSITHNENITVAGKNQGSSGMLGFHIHLLKLTPKQVLVGVFAQVGLPGLSPLNVPLIQDQIMPVKQCPSVTNGIPGQGTNGRGTGTHGRGHGGGRARRPGGRPTKSPVQNMRMRAGASVGIGLSIGVGIAALMATVMIYIYYKQFPSQDRIILVHRAAPPTTARTL